eukprot:gb/GEZN01002723.1/.p1 GENE.gb/GEZN01002723.1/~~gb/GEZN01002723.1/.p1  ORF type:complete len:704 (-),score=85.56 gb/GEZN01002723.1/:192-2303(-)
MAGLSASTSSVVEPPTNHLETFPHDTPAFWESLTQDSAWVAQLRSQLKAHADALGPKFQSINTTHFDNYHQFIVTNSEAQEAVPGFDNMGKCLKGLNGIRMQLDTELEKWGGANESEQARLASFLEQEEELLHLKLKYISKVKTYLTTKITSKAGKEKIGAKEEKIRNRKLDMALGRVDAAIKFRAIQVHKEVKTLQPLVKVFRAYKEFFEKGTALLLPVLPVIQKLEEYTKAKQEQVAIEEKRLAQLRLEWEKEAKEDKRIDKSTMFLGATGIRDLDAASIRADSGAGTTRCKGGYLFVQKPNFARVWAELDDEKFSLLHSKSTSDDFAKGMLESFKGNTEKRVKQPDIVLPCKLCTVKESTNAQFAFEFAIIAATGQKVILQADSLEGLKEWVATIQNAISFNLSGPLGKLSIAQGQGEQNGNAADDGQDDEKAIAQQLKRLRAVPGNDACADCANKDPEWASLNLGIMMCLSCSGVHRSLGVHISKVRSCKLDRLDRFLMNTLLCVGNDAALEAWEGKLLQSDKLKKSHKPNNSSKNWIRGKYEKKDFVSKPQDSSDANALLFEAVENLDPIELLRAIALGADVNGPNPEQENRTAAHHAVMYGDQRLVDLVIQNGGDLTKTESRGWTPLHYAAYQDDPDLCSLLLLRGGSRLATLESVDGATPLETSKAYCESGGTPACAAVLEEALAKAARRKAQNTI